MLKQIFSVYKHDLKAIIKNPATLIIIIGLIILPSMYAWFNIGALIDPYGNAKNLPIGIYSEDQGTKINGEKLNIGDEVINDLQSDKQLAWQFPESYSELENKVNTGDYYAAVIIPKNFSSEMVKAIDTYKSPNLKYIVNEKVNAIAPKMTEAGAAGITEQINSEVNGVVTKYLVDYSNQLNKKVLAEEDQYNTSLNSLNSLINEFSKVDLAFKHYDKITNQVDDGIELINEYNKDATTSIKNFDYDSIYQDLDKLKAAGADEKTISSVQAKIEQAQEFTTNAKQVEVDTSDYQNIDNQISNFIYNQWPSYKGQIIDGRDKLQLLAGDYESIASYLTKDGNKASDFMASPVKLETQKLYPVENYGSASMPFYTTLCLWVGSLLMVSLLAVDTKLKVSKQAGYFGKLLVFLTIGILQAVIVSLGDFTLLDITVARPELLLMYNILIVVVFVTIVFSLVYVFGNIGKAMGIIILVLSISGGGGNFPIEVSGPFFQSVYPYLPFTYGVKLLREAGAGVYLPTVFECVKILLIMMGSTICLGVIGTKYLKMYFDRFDKSSRASGIIH